MSRLVFDIEANGLRYTADKVWCIATEDVDTGVKKFYHPRSLNDGVEALKKAECLIGHNIIGYDLPVLWRILGDWETYPLIADTMLISRALDPERKGGHSLKAWGEKLGYPKGEHDDFTQYSEEMKKYCIQDVSVNVQVFKQLDKEVEDKYGTTIPGYKVYS